MFRFIVPKKIPARVLLPEAASLCIQCEESFEQSYVIYADHGIDIRGRQLRAVDDDQRLYANRGCAGGGRRSPAEDKALNY